MKKAKEIINKIKYFIDDLEFLRAYFSPFKSLKIHFYFGNIKRGVPYFHPRKWVKFTKQDAINKATEDCNNPNNRRHGQNPEDIYKEYMRYLKPIYIKWFGFTYCGLGWKTKWTSDDYRYEWPPVFSLVILKKQFAITFGADHISHYWESWLYYRYSTDRTKSTKDRLIQCMTGFPNIWTSTSYQDGKKETINFYTKILRKKYLKYIEN